MDNADEITIHNEVRLFLGDELKDFEKAKPQLYDFEAEYAQTRKNKNTLVWILLVSCFVLVGIVAFSVTRYVSYSNKNITIDIDSFDDLNIRTLLNNVGRAENQLSNARKNLASLISERDENLKIAEERKENDLFTLKSVEQISSADSIREQKKKIAESFDETVKTIHEKYDERIKEAEAELKNLEKRISAFDSGKVAQAQQSEGALDSQKLLHDLEMKSQAGQYERTIELLRAQLSEQRKQSAEEMRQAIENVRRTFQAKIDLLDPVVRDNRGEDIKVHATFERTTPISVLELSEKLSSTQTSEQFASTYEQIREKFSDFNYVADIVSTVPQEHSIPSYVNSMKWLTYEISEEMAGNVEILQKRLDKFSSFLEILVLEKNADGIVLSKNETGEIFIFVSKNAREKINSEGTMANIGLDEITIFPSDDGSIMTAVISDEAAKLRILEGAAVVLKSEQIIE